MKVKLSLLLLIVALMSGAAFAQTVAGKWVGELSATDGHGVAQPITVELKLEGEALSGTVAEGALEARPIVGATVDGSSVTFRTVRNFGGSDINVNWKGQMKGDDLTLTREQGPAPAEAGGGRGGRGGAGAGGGRGGRGGAAPAAGGARGAAGAVPPVPAPDGTDANANNAANTAAADAGAARGAGRGGGGARGGGGRGGGAAAGATPAPPAPTVTLTLHRAR